jgi:hypothetical protein
MRENTEQTEELTDALAEGIEAVMTAGEELEEAPDMADLFLEELNRLWAEPPAGEPS